MLFHLGAPIRLNQAGLMLELKRITPVPEPIHYALAVFGVIFVSTGVGCSYHGQVKRG